MAGPTARSPEFWAWLQGELQGFWPGLQVLAGYKHLGTFLQSEPGASDQRCACFPHMHCFVIYCASVGQPLVVELLWAVWRAFYALLTMIISVCPSALRRVALPAVVGL